MRKLLLAATALVALSGVAFATHDGGPNEKDRFIASINFERCGAGHPPARTNSYEVALKMMAYAKHEVEAEDVIQAVLKELGDKADAAEQSVRNYFISCENNGAAS